MKEILLSNPFDYVNSISSTKENMMESGDESVEKGYNPWITNTALSYFPDTIMLSNVVNINHHLDNRTQYEFLLASVRPRRRYSKWVKKDKETEKILEVVCRHYICNRVVGKQYISIMSNEKIKNLLDLYNNI